MESQLSEYAADAYLRGALHGKDQICPSFAKDYTRIRVDGNVSRLKARKIFTIIFSTPAHRGRNYILGQFTSLPGLAQINKDTENVCSQPNEHDQQLQM